MRTVFFGSPGFAIPSLRVVAENTTLVAVVTQPDRPAGRGRESTAPAVKTVAAALGVPVLQPDKLRTPETLAALRGLDAELFVVVAYGRILSEPMLALPRLGAYNVHASLLPALRGAAPIQWAIIRGATETGVSIMRMDAGLDTGPVVAHRSLCIEYTDTSGTLSDELATLCAGLLADTLPEIVSGRAALVAQDHAAATSAPPLTKADGRLDFGRPAKLVSAQARGVDPWPGASAMLDGEPLRLFAPRVLPPALPARHPGEVVGLENGLLVVACGDALEASIGFAELQLPGRRRLPAAAVLSGHPIPVGTRLGPS